MNGEIITIGRELLMGEIVDTNASYFAQELANGGVTVRWASQVGDDIDHLHEVIQRALNRSQVIITSGGLGPTSDDLTREAVAHVLGEPMSVDPEMLAWIEGVFRERGIANMPKTNIKQANIIPSASFLPNPGGTAPGWWVKHKDSHVFLTPGPPREIKQMWDNHIGPAVRQMTGAGIVHTRILRTSGITEGGIDEVIGDLFEKENPYLGIYAHRDGIHLRIISRAPTRAEAEAMTIPIESEIRNRIGAAIWGVDDETPSARLGQLLVDANMTVGVVDAGTGGMVASMLSQTPGHEHWFRGSLVTGPGGAPLATPLLSTMFGGTAGKSAGAVSENAALQMATSARELTGAELGIGITPPAGDDDEQMKGTIFAAFVTASGQKVVRGRFYQSLDRALPRAAMFVLTEATTALASDKV
jgi:nicotinamide-nucleotide amidase